MKKNFHLNKLTSVILGVSLMTASAHTLANEQVAKKADKEIEVIEVSGIRGSIAKSMNNKRFSSNIVDGLSAEDIGKFPDSNLAEALQRITGVSIDRSGGEGRYVSIRGMGPDFSAVTVNGREIASESKSRAFGFDTLAAELVSGIEVNKTSTAGQMEGGIGGLIDIKTAKPFDFDGFHAAGSAEMVYEDNSGEATPQGSFLVTNTLLDGKLGVLGSMTFQNREAESYQVYNEGMIHRDRPLREHRQNIADYDVREMLGTQEDIYSIQALGYGVETEERKRVGANLALQYQASDDLLLSADILYSKLDTETENNQGFTWLWANHSIDEIDANRTVIKQTHADGYTGYASLRFEKHRPSTTKMLGLNAEWQISDSLSLVADYATSTAVNDNKGRDMRQTVEMTEMPGYTLDISSGEVPSMILSQPDVTEPSVANIANLWPRHQERNGTYTEAENNQLKFDFSWDVELGALNKVAFGYHHLTKEKTNDNYKTPQDLIKAYQHGGHDVTVTDKHVGIVDHGNIFPATQLSGAFFTINEQELWDLVNDPASLDLLRNANKDEIIALVQSNGGWTARKTDDSYTIEEEVSSFYVDTYFDGDIADMSWSVVAGVRYSKTSQDSIGTMRTLVGLEQQDLDKTNLTPTYSGFTQGVVDNDYDNWLPSLSANLFITEELIARVGASKTMTRPTLTDLAPSLSFSGGSTEERSAKGNNPTLKPYLSTNFDVSLEWYYNEASMLSAAYFSKTVDDFIIKTNAPEEFDLEFGQEWSSIVVNRPRNGEEAKIDGIELNWTHSFDNGFGFQVNATFVDSDAELDNNNQEQVFALEGLSDSSNVVAFYEKGPYQFRVAYNVRGDFLETQINPYAGEPIYVEEYDQIDISGSYQVNDNMSVYFEGINIGGSTVSKHGRYDNHFISYADYGSRYAVGVRASF